VEHPDDRHPDECCRTVPEVTVPNRTRGDRKPLPQTQRPALMHEADLGRCLPNCSLSRRSGRACSCGSCGFDLFDPVSRGSRSIRPQFVQEFPLERNDRPRAARH
jgi:hypothetical protein